MDTAIRPSPELEAIVNRWQEAFRQRDARTIENLLSKDASLRFIGSDHGEYWTGDVLRAGMGDHVLEIPELTYEVELVEAFEKGSIGWGLWVGGMKFAGQEETYIHRISFVFALEEGVWRVAQIHCSNPTSNVEKLGVEVLAIEALAQQARDGFRLDQKVGVATIMFSDIVGSTQLATTAGDRIWAARIASHLEDAEAIVTRHGGQVVKSLGDGVMSSFTTTPEALAAAQELQKRSTETEGEEAHLPLRIGLHCGDVIQTKDDFFGNVVNKSARIAATAGAGEVRVSDDVRMLATDQGFAFASPALVPLKGFDGDQLTHLLVWNS